MPRLSDSMEEGLLLQWLIEDGAEVSVGDELVEIETDKATMVYEAEAAGVLEIVVAEGSTVSVGDVIARVGEGSPVSANGDGAAGGAASARGAGAENGARDEAIDEPAIERLERASAAPPTTLPQPRSPTAPATPVAKRVAGAHGVALEQLQGSRAAGADHQDRRSRCCRDRRRRVAGAARAGARDQQGGEPRALAAPEADRDEDGRGEVDGPAFPGPDRGDDGSGARPPGGAEGADRGGRDGAVDQRPDRQGRRDRPPRTSAGERLLRRGLLHPPRSGERRCCGCDRGRARRPDGVRR